MNKIINNFCEQQIIDEKGKLRGYVLKNNIVILCFPQRPIVKHVAKIDDIKIAKVDIIKKFFSDNGITLDEKKNYFEVGDYIIPKEKNFYHPLNLLSAQDDSEYKEIYYSKNLAKVLQEYTLFTYSQKPTADYNVPYVIKPDHKYDLKRLDNRLFLEDNDIMYFEKKLIYPSEKIRDYCKTHLITCIRNDEAAVRNVKFLKKIRGRFDFSEEYKKHNFEKIFVDEKMLEEYASSIGPDKTIIHQKFLTISEPYFFQNDEVFDGKLYRIQNFRYDDGFSYERAKKNLLSLKDGHIMGFFTRVNEMDKQKTFYNYHTQEFVHEDKSLAKNFSEPFICFFENRFFLVYNSL